MVHLIKSIAMVTKEKIKKDRKPPITNAKKKVITKRTSLASLFGANKKEVDGLEFQKKVRNEWQ